MSLLTFVLSFIIKGVTVLVLILIIDVILWKYVIKRLLERHRQPMPYQEINVNQISSSNDVHSITSSTYKVLKGTVNKGESYETIFIANVVLKLVLNSEIEDFSLYSNAEDFLPFDDLVIEMKTVDGFKRIAVQLKHKDGSLTLDNLKRNKGKFSIKKLFEKVKYSKQLEDFKLILLTNYKLNYINKSFKLEDEKFKITMKRCKSEKLLEKGNSYEFQVDDTASDEYRKFFSHFFLYSGQLNADQMENALLQQFQQEFCCEKSVFWEYFNFFTKWSTKEGRRNKLNKTWMKEMIAIHVLSPLVHPMSSDSQDNKNTDILRKSINDFSITMFEQNNTKSITGLWSVQSIKKLLKEEDVKTINKRNTSYQIIPYIENFADLKNDEFSIAVWLLDKCPLIIKYEKCVIKAIQFIKHKKFVILYKDNIDQEFKNSFSNLKIFQNLADLKNNFPLLYKELVKTFHCSLQGKPKISLETLIGGHQRFEKQFTTNDLLLFLSDDLTIGEKEVLPKIYIERYFFRHITDYNFLSEVEKDTVIFISNFNTSNKHLKQFEMEDIDTLLKEDLNTEESEDQKIFYFCRNYCSQENIEAACCKLGGINKYHHFTIFDENLEWICSRGGVEKLKKFQNEDKLIEDKKLYVSDNNIMIICGDPGLGKTTSMKYLKNSTYSSFWTFLVYPKDHSKYFRENQKNANFIEYLLGVSDLTSRRFGLKILEILLTVGHVNFIWDGLDEISEKNLNVVLDIIDVFSKKGWKQCITSRNNLRNKLETKFSAVATTISQFNEEVQKSYIKKRLSCSEEELKSIFTIIQNNISLFKYNEILSIPLQIYIFTELLIHNNREKYSALLKNTFSLTDLYYHFILQKFNIYFNEKENACDINDNAEKKNEEYKSNRIRLYQSVALKMYFSEEGVNCFDYNECELFLTDMKKHKDSVGIITGVSLDNLPNFIHNSYGEFFAAHYLSKNYKNISNLSQFLFKEKYKNIRFLFDLILAQDCPAHIAVLCKNFQALKAFKKMSLTSKDHGGRNPLQLACSWGEMFPLLEVTVENDERYIVHEKIEDTVKIPNLEHQKILQYLSDICDPENIDDVYKLNSFFYADTSLSLSNLAILSEKHIVRFQHLKNFKSIPVILYYSAAFDFSIIFNSLKTIPKVYTQKGDSLLSVAATNGSLSTCEQLVIKHNLNVNTINKNNETPLHKASENGHFEIVKLLINNKAKVDAVNKYGFTSLLAASVNGHIEIAKLLINNKAKVNAGIKWNDTPLHAASASGGVEIVKLLINHEAKVNAVNIRGNTPLHVVSANGQIEIAKLFICNKAQVDVVNKRGYTPLALACKNGHVEIVKLLIDNKAQVDAVNKSGDTPLHIASASGHVKIVDIFINNKAQLDAVNKRGYTPLDLAFKNGHHETVNLLTKKEAKK